MNVVQIWECNGCNEVWLTRSDAVACCSPGTTERFACGVCAFGHKSEAMADACCREKAGKKVSDGSNYNQVKR
jgi:hypothetical protein